MGFGRGILLWLLGVPIPVIILLALFLAPLSWSPFSEPRTPLTIWPNQLREISRAISPSARRSQARY